MDVKNYYGESDILPEDPIGLLFRRPRIEFKGAENKLYIEGMVLQSAGVPLDNFEVWSQLIVLIDKQKEAAGKVPDSVIINDSDRSFTYIYGSEGDTIDKLNVSFTNLINNTDGLNDEFVPEEPNTIDVDDDKPVITKRITYADLTGTGEYAIFKNSCYSCHGGGQTSGGLALDSFAEAVASGATIVDRMNDAARPMPRSGLLSPRAIAIVEKWLDGGLPRN